MNVDDCKLEIKNQEALQQLRNQIKEKLPTILENPVIVEFLDLSKENKALFDKAIYSSCNTSLQTLNTSFKEFHRINRIVRYISGFIRRYPIDYDKRVKARRKRFKTIPGKTFDSRVEYAAANELIQHRQEVEKQVLENEQKEQGFIFAKNEKLNQAFNSLNEKQKRILLLAYDDGLNNREIGEVFGETEQNIAYWKRKTLRQLRDSL